jgi:DNA-binding NarL/FixJ family response regulator
MVIMDKRMPGIGGIEATRLLTERQPHLVVLLISVEDPDPTVVQCCGAVAFLRG